MSFIKKIKRYRKIVSRFICRNPFTSFFVISIPFILFIIYLLGLFCTTFHREITYEMKKFICDKKALKINKSKELKDFFIETDKILSDLEKRKIEKIKCDDDKK